MTSIFWLVPLLTPLFFGWTISLTGEKKFTIFLAINSLKQYCIFRIVKKQKWSIDPLWIGMWEKRRNIPALRGLLEEKTANGGMLKAVHDIFEEAFFKGSSKKVNSSF